MNMYFFFVFILCVYMYVCEYICAMESILSYHVGEGIELRLSGFAASTFAAEPSCWLKYLILL